MIHALIGVQNFNAECFKRGLDIIGIQLHRNDAIAQTAQITVQDIKQNRQFAIIVVIDVPLGYAAGFGNLGHGRACHATLGKYPCCGGQDFVAFGVIIFGNRADHDINDYLQHGGPCLASAQPCPDRPL